LKQLIQLSGDKESCLVVNLIIPNY